MRARTPFKVFRVAALIVVVLALLAPLVWMVAASFKTNVDIYDPGKAVRLRPDAGQLLQGAQAGELRAVHREQPVGGLRGHGAVAGPRRARGLLDEPLQHAASALVVLMARVIPAVSLLVPWYYVFSNLRMVGGFTVLILSHMFVSLPLIVYIMMGYFDGLPMELEESALVDGLTRSARSAGSRCRCPTPGIATAGILSFIFSWNNFMFALVLSGADTKTLPVAIFDFVGYASHRLGRPDGGVDRGHGADHAHRALRPEVRRLRPDRRRDEGLIA